MFLCVDECQCELTKQNQGLVTGVLREILTGQDLMMDWKLGEQYFVRSSDDAVIRLMRPDAEPDRVRVPYGLRLMLTRS